MAINIASLNANGLKSRSKQFDLLGDLDRFRVDVAAIEETHFVTAGDAYVLTSDFDVYSAYGTTYSRGVSLLVRSNLASRVDIVHRCAEGRMIVADVTIRYKRFRLIAVYARRCESGPIVRILRQINPIWIES